MQIYYYCSYEGSPAGYHIGRITDSSCDNGLQELSIDKINPFIRQCFEIGMIRSGFGEIPGSVETPQQYFLLKKKLTAIKTNVKYYINFAIVTGDWEEFKTLMKKENTEAEIINNFLESIEPAPLFYFGYRIRTERLKKISSCGYGGICEWINHKYLKMIEQSNALFIETSTDKPDIEALEQSLMLKSKIEDRNLERSKIAEKLFCYKKKIDSFYGNDIWDSDNFSGDSGMGSMENADEILKSEVAKKVKILRDKVAEKIKGKLSG